MSWYRYLWELVRSSFTGTFRVLEIAEAVLAIIVHSLGYRFPEWKESLDGAFVVLAALLVVTFFIGLFVAAYRSQLRADESRRIADERLRPAIRIREEVEELSNKHYGIRIETLGDI